MPRSAIASTAATTARRCARRRCVWRPTIPCAEADIEPWVSLIEILDASDAEVMRRWGRWYVADRDPRWVRRNALVALGNVGRPTRPRRSPVPGPVPRARRCDVASPCRVGRPSSRARLAAARRRTRSAGDRRDGGCAMKHLLVTNDFPPKIGGIQSLLWEWWRRLPPESFAVLTSPYSGAAAFDADQPFHIERTREPVLLPHPWMVSHIDDMANRVGADLIVLDPAVPLGLVGPSLRLAVRRRAARCRGHRARSPARHEAVARLRAARCTAHRGRRQLPGQGGRACRRAQSSDHGRAARRRHRSVPAADRRPTWRRSGTFRPTHRRRTDRRHQQTGASQGLRHGDPRRSNAAPFTARPAAGDLR